MVILCACSSGCVGILLYVILVLVLLAVFYYIGIRHTAIIVLYRILRLLIIPALRRNFAFYQCEGQCKPSVVHSHYGLEHLCGARVGKRSAAVVLAATRPPKPPCWVYYAPRCRHSRHRRAGKSKEVCSQQPGKPVSSLHPCIPQPQGDETARHQPPKNRPCSAPHLRHNLSRLCNWMPGPQPQHQFSLSHTI